jgi:predicted DNA-binding protein YlxM (UPF0122 family)
MERADRRVLLLTDEEIVKRYDILKMSALELANECHCDTRAILRRLKRNGCHVRNPKEACNTEPHHRKMLGVNKRNDLSLPNEEIIYKYSILNISMKNIAKEFRCGSNVIKRILSSNCCHIRGREEFKLNIPVDDIADKYYNQGLSPNKIAEDYNCNATTIVNKLKANGYKLRNEKQVHVIRRLKNDYHKQNRKIKLPISDAELLYLYNDGNKSVREIEKTYHYNHKKVTKRLKDLGVHVKSSVEVRGRKLILTDEEILYKYNILKMSVRQIAQECNCEHVLIVTRLKRMGCDTRPKEASLSLTDKQVVNKYSILLESVKDIAKECGCDTKKVRKILRRNECRMRSRKENESLNKAHGKYRISQRKLILSDEELIYKYDVLHLTGRKLAQECHCSDNFLRTRLKRLGCKIRNRVESWDSLPDSEKDIRIQKSIIASHIQPNGAETRIQSILDEVDPNKWMFTGDGKTEIENGKHSIGRKIPDFWNGDHKLIEHFGIKWHDPIKRPERLTDEQLIKHYAKYGYKCLVIWENEWRKPETIKNKIREFAAR